ERPLDLAADRIDVAFRAGVLDDSEVIAKHLIPMQRLVCAAPDYVVRHGLPATVGELAAHASNSQRQANGRLQPWEFRVDGRP
ncbi:LysR substrate-binding domain-containing protein, partial [Stenotrophomonas sp. SrG]|uniref:LysR substrate-binding domain-containing protein n=1 Tax=Stenotrophomonas sp. SrG TaxID=3414430 RepID=UPI003CF18090